VRPRTRHRQAVAIVAALTLAAVTAALAGAPAAGASSVSCRSLSASQIPVAALEASYRKLTGLPSNRPLKGSQPRRFGVCGRTHYAFELFTVASTKGLTERQLVAQQYHSPVWKQQSNGQWVDEGLTSLCKLAPAQLINLWKVGVTCKT
jgi:hypothetical protein